MSDKPTRSELLSAFYNAHRQRAFYRQEQMKEHELMRGLLNQIEADEQLLSILKRTGVNMHSGVIIRYDESLKDTTEPLRVEDAERTPYAHELDELEMEAPVDDSE